MIPEKTLYYQDHETDFDSFLGDPEWIPTYSQLRQRFQYANNLELGYTLRNNDIRSVYEFFNQDFINHLSLYLIDLFQTQNLQPRKVLEICAGDGLLSHFLNQQLAQSNIKIVPTDSGINRIQEWFPIEKLTHQQAVEKYPYPVILCSWMPRNLDLTPVLRQSPFTSEYILIGDPQVCGTNESWCPEYPNFKRHSIKSAHQFQFGITDSPSEGVFKSQIYAFKSNNSP